MAFKKPLQITDEEWAQTPPAVQALLVKAVTQTQQTDDLPNDSATLDEGDTVRIPLSSSVADEPATIRDTLVSEPNEGATVNMPLPDKKRATPSDIPVSNATETEGATTRMPFPELTEDEGATFAMPRATDNFDSQISAPVDDMDEAGGTRRMPQSEEDEGATMAMAFGAASTLEDGGTMAMSADTESEDYGETVRMSKPELNDGATVAMSDTSSLEDGGTVAASLQEDGATTAMPLRPVDDTADGDSTVTMDDDGGTVAMSGLRATDVSPVAPTIRAADPAKTQPQIKQIDDIAAKNIVLQGRYRLLKILGKGGFGAAYLAHDINLERECVVKQMLSAKGISPRELAQNQANFQHEARLLASLNSPGHPNIPEIFDYFSDENGSYLVMKYIEGQSLDAILKVGEGGKIPWREAVRHAIDVCSALNYMHTQGEEPVMHRDIKPANILLGDDGRIWLVDFGLAQAKPVENTDDLSAADAAGSVGYTPFEQWVGEAVPASDIYAAGVTLHHMVTGLSPLEAYRESGRLEVNIQKMQEMHGQLESIRKVDRKLPKELDEIINRAVTAEPDQRLTALQFEQQLEVLVLGAKNAVLFTFKNGQSAKTIPQLVDLCEQNRVEAQGYLYRGDFERWFTLINRNDLADAAAKAVKQEGKGKDGLERFLKLIMPNLFWRRMGKASYRVARVGLQLLIIVLLALLIVVFIGTFTGRWLLQRGIANRNWDYYALELDKDNVFTEDYLTENAENMTRAFLEFVQVDTLSPNQIIINANAGGVLWLRIPVGVRLEGNRPQISLTEVNGLPIYWIGNNLAAGANNGINQALASAPVKITGLDVKDDALVFQVAKSDTVAYAPPTPAPDARPTSTPTPLPTPTPPGLALLAVFNELPRPVILEIEGQRWLIEANDTKVIEKPPGTYDYILLYAENGQLAAQGSKSWDYRAYRWRISEQGDILE